MSPRTVRPILVKPSFVHYGDRPAARLSDGALLALAAAGLLAASAIFWLVRL